MFFVSLRMAEITSKDTILIMANKNTNLQSNPTSACSIPHHSLNTNNFQKALFVKLNKCLHSHHILETGSFQKILFLL